MKLNIVGKNVPITNAMRSHITEKLEKLNKYEYFSADAIANVTVRTVKDDQIIEFCATQSGGHIVRGETRDANLYNAVDSLEELLKRKLRKNKEKRVAKRLRGASKFEDMKNSEEYITTEAETYDDSPRIVREKKLELNMMSAEEAVEQMELLDHDFYLYKDADTGLAAVIYRRKDGNYGVIKEE